MAGCKHHDPREFREIVPHELASRRSFLGWMFSFLAALMILPKKVWAKTIAFRLSKVKALEKVGGHVKIKLKGHELILVRDAETSMKAINPACTHKKCTVQYSSKTKLLHCPCHKSAYGLDGTVLDGPAPKPLGTYSAALRGDKVLVKLP